MPRKEGANEIRIDSAVFEIGTGLSLAKIRDSLQVKNKYIISNNSTKFNKFRVIQPLSAGLNTITHNLNLANTAVQVTLEDAVTGSQISFKKLPSGELTNSTAITVSGAVTSAIITIIG